MRDYYSGNRLKRHGNELEGCEWNYGDYAGLKCRRLSDDSSRHAYSENYFRLSLGRSYRNCSSKSSADKYSSRNHESSLPTRSVYDRHRHSPGHSEGSPHDRARYYDHKDLTPVRPSPYSRDRSQYSREKSPHGWQKSSYNRNWDRSRHHDHKSRSPNHAEWSPQDRGQHNDRRDHTPNLIEKSPCDRTKPDIHREIITKTLSSEKHNLQDSFKDQEDRHIQTEANHSDIESQGEHNASKSIERDVCCEPEKQKQSFSPPLSCKDSSGLEPPPEELLSMEEDMNICDTPPHVPVVVDSSSGKWFYLDYHGVDYGPSKLYDIKVLVDNGVLMSDHFIKHMDSDRWLTVENAVSPVAVLSFPSVVSDTITQLVNPPKASGNLLADAGDILQSGLHNHMGILAPSLQPMLCSEVGGIASELLGDLHIDERVGVLLEGYDVIQEGSLRQ